MKAEDFAAWLSAISGMNEGQRTEAIAALEKASAVGAEGGGSAKKASKRGRQKDALGTTSHERVAAQGCPHCAGREVVGWGRSHGLLRFRCKSCGRTFNALTKTPMAHLRKKEKWLDHARAMIEGKSLAKTAQLCGVHPTTAFRWRHRFLRAPAVNKPRSLSGIVEADETFVLEYPSRADGPICRARAAQTRRQGQASGALPGQYSRSRRPRPEGRDLRRGPASGRRGFHRKSACRRRHTGQSSDRRRRPANRRLRPQSRDFRSTRCSRQESQPRKRLICTSTTSTPTTAASNSGSTASTASPPRTCQTISDGARASKPWATNSNRQTGSKARSGNGPYQQLTL